MRMSRRALPSARLRRVDQDRRNVHADEQLEAPRGLQTRRATVVATDPRPIVRAGLRAVLGAADDVALDAVCATDEVLDAIEQHLPAVLVVSINGTESDPFRVVATATALHPGMAVMVVTDATSVVDLREGVTAGADSFLLSDSTAEELAAGVLATARGERAVSPAVAMQLASAWHEDPRARSATQHLTPRELEVVTRLADGMTNQQIGEALGLSARTVKTHVQNILGKLEAPDRTGAVARAFRLGLIR